MSKPTWITDEVICLSREIHETGEWEKPPIFCDYFVLPDKEGVFAITDNEKWMTAKESTSIMIIPLTDVIDFLTFWNVEYSMVCLDKKKVAFVIQPRSKNLQSFTSKTATEAGLKGLLYLLKRAKGEKNVG